MGKDVFEMIRHWGKRKQLFAILLVQHLGAPVNYHREGDGASGDESTCRGDTNHGQVERPSFLEPLKDI